MAERKSILILEDNPIRVELMREVLSTLPDKPDVLTWDNAWTMRKDLPKWLPAACLISLDHDLADSTTRNPGCGMDMVEALARRAPCCSVLDPHFPGAGG